MRNVAAPIQVPPHPGERYSAGYGTAVLQDLSRRKASREAAFLLPHLRPGSRLLDCGCGPGYLTVDLAQMLSPGEVVGLDMGAEQLEVGRALARTRDVKNIRFEAGTVYSLPFPDRSFDAVLAHAVLYHLGSPQQALAEIFRVLKPGGVLGVRDACTDSDIVTPATPELEKAWKLLSRCVGHNGGNTLLGKRLRPLLREAGFTSILLSASFDTYGTPEETRKMGAAVAELLSQPQIVGVVIEKGLATAEELGAISQAFRVWGDHPDAFCARARCEAVGWKPLDPHDP
jgi:ubiquinone/menaquinone biosynthesis C-methylase UbiE